MLLTGGTAQGTETLTASDLHVDGRRLMRRFEALRGIGHQNRNGVSRIAFTPEDRLGRDFVTALMREAGLTPEVDPAGNLVGRSPEAADGAPVLMLGSHIDTVPNGGAYDGALGVLAAVEVAQTIREKGLSTRNPLVVTAFANEEGGNGTPGMWGSHAMAGSLTHDHLSSVDSFGNPMGLLVSGVGGDLRRIDTAAWPDGSIDAYLELHIEQGPVLEHEGVDIGVVNAITGRVSLDVDIVGRTNHAGTTPMELRRDALVAAAQVILTVRDTAGRDGLVRVATVGRCEVEPGAWNVVPGQVRLRVDLRDVSTAALDRAITFLRERVRALGAGTGTDITVNVADRVVPAPCDPRLMNLFEEASDTLGLTRLTMPSGAGHDAQIIAAVAPVGMVFIPSTGGVSHAPDEHSTTHDVLNGADVLLHAALSHGSTP